MHLDPAGGAGHVLAVVLRPPALHEGHPGTGVSVVSPEACLDNRYLPDGAHLGQLVHRLEPVVDGLRQQRRELLVVEDLQTAAGWDLQK